MSGVRYRLIDTSGSEIGIVTDKRPDIGENDVVTLPAGMAATVLEVYDDEHGQEGGVVATLVVEASARQAEQANRRTFRSGKHTRDRHQSHDPPAASEIGRLAQLLKAAGLTASYPVAPPADLPPSAAE